MAAPKTDAWAGIVHDLLGPRFLAELRTSWAIAVLYRAPAIPVVWACARLRLGPSAVTLTALLLAVSMPLQALALPVGWAPWCVALSGALFQVLDCADGALARLTGRTTQIGAKLDSLVDLAQWGALYLAIGILADRTLGSGWGWTAVAAAAAWARLFARLIRNAAPAAPGRNPVAAPQSHWRWPVAVVSGLSGLIPFLALGGSWLWLAVLFLLIYAALDVGDAALGFLAAHGA